LEGLRASILAHACIPALQVWKNPGKSWTPTLFLQNGTVWNAGSCRSRILNPGYPLYSHFIPAKRNYCEKVGVQSCPYFAKSGCPGCPVSWMFCLYFTKSGCPIFNLSPLEFWTPTLFLESWNPGILDTHCLGNGVERVACQHFGTCLHSGPIGLAHPN